MKKLQTKRLVLRKETLLRLQAVVGGTSNADACLGNGDGAQETVAGRSCDNCATSNLGTCCSACHN